MSLSIRQLKEDFVPSPCRIWYNEWVKNNARGKVLDVGKSKYWDYGFQTIDTDETLKPTYQGSIEKTEFKDKEFDLVLCNGMYECVEYPQKMIDECLRIGKKVLFGFVGENYKPYKPDWKFYKGGMKKEIKNFNNGYHFILCESAKQEEKLI